MIPLILGVLLIALTTYLIMTYIVPSATLTDVVPSPVLLAENKIILSSDDVTRTLLGSGESTLIALIRVQMGDRTPRDVNSTFPLLKVDGAFSLEIAPTNIGNTSTTSQLRIMSGPNPSDVDTMTLPNFPLQKWVYVAILRSGRRFDVYYNDDLVASHTFSTYPRISSNPLRMGDANLLGHGVHVLVANKRISAQDAAIERRRLVDGAGAPRGIRLPTIQSVDLPGEIANACIPGLPCDNIGPAPGFNVWGTLFPA
jgi:hypothetical protein